MKIGIAFTEIGKIGIVWRHFNIDPHLKMYRFIDLCGIFSAFLLKIKWFCEVFQAVLFFFSYLPGIKKRLEKNLFPVTLYRNDLRRVWIGVFYVFSNAHTYIKTLTLISLDVNEKIAIEVSCPVQKTTKQCVLKFSNPRQL